MYSEHIRINRNFQSSVNLELDLLNPKKIDEYIPTTDICDVLKIYVKSMLGTSKDRATTLVGPYGKGKSFLLQVLTYIVFANKSEESYVNLLVRIQSIDPELYKLIKELKKKHVKLLPIIINSNYDSMNQSFMIALNEAVARSGLTTVIPDTVYSVCIELLDKWLQDEKQAENVRQCAAPLKIHVNQLRRDLTNYSQEAYTKFESLYNCLTTGQSFNPLISDDVVKIYSSVNHEICKQGYKGMFIVFDEFSKFIESSDTNLMKDLKIIQDIAEAAARSSEDEQLHLCCVTHKNLNLYSYGNGKTDAFKTVEGRFKEIKFNRSLEENYQIISAAIRKTNYNRQLTAFMKKHELFYESVKQSQPFQKVNHLDDLFRGVFPLNPITVYALVQLSEILAQNERTLFTFISDTDDNSFNSFIHQTDEGLFNVDKVYDYFSQLMKSEKTNLIQNTWYSADGTLSSIEDLTDKKIIKALAVIVMINNNDRFAPTVENIALATMLDKNEVQKHVNQLIEGHYIRLNYINNLLAFASSNNKEIEEKLNVIIKSKLKAIPFDTVADDVNETKYVLPRRHNEQNKITRFLRVRYLTEEELMNSKSFQNIKNEMFCDGLVLNLFRKTMSEKRIKELMKEINDPSVILRYPSSKIDGKFDDIICRYAALKDLVNKGGNDRGITVEIGNMLEEATEDIENLLEQYFGETSSFCHCSYEVKDFNELLSVAMDNVYSCHVKFNNELVNKNSVTTQYQKSINNVITWMFNGSKEDQFNYSETSPERTVLNSVVAQIDKQENVRDIVNAIKTKITNSESKKLDISLLVKEYTNPPYGIRKGILPILIGKAISELSDNVILYMKNQEIDLSTENIVKSVNSVNNTYFFGFAKGSKEQTEYLYRMLAVLNVEPNNNFRLDVKRLAEELRRFYMGLPTIIRSSVPNKDFLGIGEENIEYMKGFIGFNINPYELIFTSAKTIFKTEKYSKILSTIEKFKGSWNQKVDSFKTSICTEIKKSLQIKQDTSLKMGIHSVILEKVGTEKPRIGERNLVIYNCLMDLNFNDIDAVNSIAYAILGSYIEDWGADRKAELLEQFSTFMTDLANAERMDLNTEALDDIIRATSKQEMSELAILMKNNIVSVFDEYGESVTTDEKITVLSEILKKYL